MSQPFNFYTSSKNLSEYYAVVTRGANPFLTSTEAAQDLWEIYNLCKILYPTSKSYEKLLSLTAEHHPKGLLFHDFEIASIALSHGIDRIATINKDDFNRISDIRVVTI